MSTQSRVHFDHSRHKFTIHQFAAKFSVLAFEGEEHLSQPFSYRIEFTCPEQDLSPEQMLNKDARFSLYPLSTEASCPGLPVPEVKPLRSLYGMVNSFQRLSASRDEARYEITLQPRLALLGRGRQYRLYQQQSVPEIVKHILGSRHGFLSHHFLFELVREYPRREQVMQYGESDLAFIERLLAEVGIWYRFSHDDRLQVDVVQFHDDQRHYQFGVQLPLRAPAGFASGEDAVWQLQTRHQVVEKTINFRAYHHRDARAWLDGEVDQTRDTTSTTYGEAYHYAEPYRVLGDSLNQDEHLQSESGFFYARLRHERYLNAQTHLSGASSSATLAPGQVLKLTDDATLAPGQAPKFPADAPQAFARGAVITGLHTRAARDRSIEVHFESIPYAEMVCFRPAIPAKPIIAGTLPARLSSPDRNDRYAEIDLEGRYRVRFLFDRDTWKPGQESAWLRLARPYGGDTHGLHLPMLTGTEVAVAFEQGDPDRPYIAHALHDSEHPDPVTLRNYKRNVLRTPANNKLRMEDQRGEEHVKLSTEHSGKSQLNLGHLVDAQKQKRGEGFELRSDGHGAIRGGKGLLISTEEQPKAQGNQLDMDAAIAQLESALSLARSLAEAARSAQATPGDTDSQQRLTEALKGLAQPGVLLHAPAGIGLVSPEAVCVSSGAESVAIVAAHNTDISAGQNITATADGGVSLLAQRAALQLKAAHGKVELHALDSELHALAMTDIRIESLTGRLHLSAPKEVLIDCGGAYIRMKDGEIELGAPGNIYLKGAHVQKLGATSVDTPITPLRPGYSGRYTLKDEAQTPQPFINYRITTRQGAVFTGVTDRQGQTRNVHSLLPGGLKIEFPDKTPAFGPGHWVTIDHDYHGLKNTALMVLNRLTSMGEEGRVFGSEGKDYENTKRDKIQEWKPLPDDSEDSLKSESAVHVYGTKRTITQAFMEGEDAWATGGRSWYWQPATGDDVYEKKVEGK